MSRTERSRSPHGGLSLALPGSSGPLPSSSGPLPRSFDLEKMELVLGGYVVKVYHFADEPDMPWFQAKPIAVHLEYAHVNHAFSHVDSDDKLSLKELIEKKGCPIGGRSDSDLLGYNDGKAIYINESGLYSLILGSKKKEARMFKCWVTGEVLPSIRRQGCYGSAASAPVEMSQVPTAPRSCTPRPSATPAALPEACLDWMKDLSVSRQELQGVKTQFKAILAIEISAGQHPKSPVEAWTKAPPVRFRELAEGAVSSYRSLLERRYSTMTVGDVASTARSGQGSENEGDDDILTVSEIMMTAGVWQAVWSSYRSDLSNQMLSLKCAETGASFSARRPEVVQGHIHVVVHKYKKSTDWPLAWKALQNTRDVYEKRVRECLDDVFQMTGRPAEESSRLARDIAACLRVSA